jgi:hypothetical protein
VGLVAVGELTVTVERVHAATAIKARTAPALLTRRNVRGRTGPRKRVGESPQPHGLAVFDRRLNDPLQEGPPTATRPSASHGSPFAEPAGARSPNGLFDRDHPVQRLEAGWGAPSGVGFVERPDPGRGSRANWGGAWLVRRSRPRARGLLLPALGDPGTAALSIAPRRRSP